MQLEFAGRLSRESILAIPLMIGGLEVFLGLSSSTLFKTAGLALVFAGIVLLGAGSWLAKDVVGKFLVALVFGLYLASATARFPGLAKEAYPLGSLSVFRLLIKGTGLIMAGAAAVGVVFGLIRLVRSRLLPSS